MAFGRAEPREWLFGGRQKVYAMDFTGMIVIQSIVSSASGFKKQGREGPPSTWKSLAEGHKFGRVISNNPAPWSGTHDVVLG